MTALVLEVTNDRTTIKGLLSKICVDQIKFSTSYQVPGAQFSRAFQKRFWDGRKNLFDTRQQSFPTGLLSRVRSILVQNGHSVKIQDLRVRPKPSLQSHPKVPVQLRPYQVEAVSLSCQKQRGIIRIGTGGGKSIVAASIVADLKVPTLVLVHKKDLMWQLVDTLQTTLGVKIGTIGAGECKIYPISVGMIQTVARLFDSEVEVEKDEYSQVVDPEAVVEYVRQVGCVIADEAHHLAASQYEVVLSNCTNAYYRFGLSATPFRTDQADLLIEAHTAPKIVDISASFLIKQGYLAAPTIYMYQFKHKKQPTDLSYAKLYTTEIVENAARNAEIVKLALAAVEAGKSVLVAVTRVAHGEELEKLLLPVEPTTIFAHGKMDSLDRKKILQDLNVNKRKIVISTTVFGEGVDVPNLQVLITVKAADSAIDALQLAGRVLRVTPSKHKAVVVDIADTGCRFLTQHTQNRVVTYQSEPLYDIREVMSVSEVQF